jgi:hypothetical protein
MSANIDNIEITALYDNGEPVATSRMEDESWYPDYQSLMEINTTLGEKTPTIKELLALFEKDYRATFGKEYPNKERLLRWCVFLHERMSHLESEVDDQ